MGGASSGPVAVDKTDGVRPSPPRASRDQRMNHHRGRGRGRYTRQGSSGRWAQPQRNEERVAAQNAFNLAIHTGSTPEAAKAAGEAAANAIRMGRPYEEAVRAGVTAARAHADGASRRKSNRFSLRRSRSRCALTPVFLSSLGCHSQSLPFQPQWTQLARPPSECSASSASLLGGQASSDEELRLRLNALRVNLSLQRRSRRTVIHRTLLD